MPCAVPAHRQPLPPRRPPAPPCCCPAPRPRAGSPWRSRCCGRSVPARLPTGLPMRSVASQPARLRGRPPDAPPPPPPPPRVPLAAQGTEADASAPGAPTFQRLSAPWRMMLLSCGSVTRHLEVMSGGRMRVECLQMQELGDGTGLAGLPPEVALLPGPYLQRQASEPGAAARRCAPKPGAPIVGRCACPTSPPSQLPPCLAAHPSPAPAPLQRIVHPAATPPAATTCTAGPAPRPRCPQPPHGLLCLLVERRRSGRRAARCQHAHLGVPHPGAGRAVPRDPHRVPRRQRRTGGVSRPGRAGLGGAGLLPLRAERAWLASWALGGRWGSARPAPSELHAPADCLRYRPPIRRPPPSLPSSQVLPGGRALLGPLLPFLAGRPPRHADLRGLLAGAGAAAGAAAAAAWRCPEGAGGGLQQRCAGRRPAAGSAGSVVGWCCAPPAANAGGTSRRAQWGRAPRQAER